MQVWFRDFNVVAKDLIEANLQRGDSRAFALALFHRGDDLFAVLAQVAELIQLGVIARADHPGIGGQRRRLVGNGAFEPFPNIG